MAWHEITPPGGSPEAPRFHAAIIDPLGDRLVVFGGYGFLDFRNDVMTLSLSGAPGWTSIVPDGAPPPPRADARAAYDSFRHRMLVYGGSARGGPFGDLWSLSLDASPAWSPLLPVNDGPGARAGASLVYDALRDRLILFGGSDGMEHQDVWELPLAGSPEWTELPTTGEQPPPRKDHAAFYDGLEDRMLVLGGAGRSSTDAYALDLATNQWAPIVTAGSPPLPMNPTTAVFDSVRRRLIAWNQDLYGLPYGPEDILVLELEPAPRAYMARASGPTPGTSIGYSMTFDPARDRALVYGGAYDCPCCCNPPIPNDPSVWSLDVSTPASFSVSTPGPVMWNGAAVQVVAYTVSNFSDVSLEADWTLETKDPGFALPTAGSVFVPPNASATVLVTLGITGNLRAISTLTFRAHPQGTPASEDTAAHAFFKTLPIGVHPVPPPAVALSPSRPNPSKGSVSWTLELPHATRVTLAIFDLAGRELWRAPFGELPAGVATLTWPGFTRRGNRPPPGVYVAVVNAGGRRYLGKFVTGS